MIFPDIATPKPGIEAKFFSRKERHILADKKLVEEITPMDVDFAQWYTDIVKKAELAEYTSVKG